MKKKSIFTMYEYVLTLVVIIIISFITDIGSPSFKMKVATALICGAGMPLYFIYQIGQQTRLLRKGDAAVATVTGYKDVDYNPDDPSYVTYFEFTAQEKTYTGRSGQKFSTQHYKIGEQVKIHYNPDNPKEAEIDDYFDAFLGWLLIIRGVWLIAVAGICIVAGLFYFLK